VKSLSGWVARFQKYRRIEIFLEALKLIIKKFQNEASFSRLIKPNGQKCHKTDEKTGH